VSELKPCPFCGESPEYFSHSFYIVRSVACQTLGCPLKGKAISLQDWNHRTEAGRTESRDTPLTAWADLLCLIHEWEEMRKHLEAGIISTDQAIARLNSTQLQP
jgi:hypothetical protein